MVFAKPYTNLLFSRSFEAGLARMIPGVLRLQEFTTYSEIPGPGIAGVTNGVGIRAIAVESTPAGAMRAANDAVQHLCLTTLTNDGATGKVVDQAVIARTRRYSYFHDDFQSAVARLFKR